MVDALRGDGGEPCRKADRRLGGRVEERRVEGHRAHLRRRGFDDLLAPVADVDAPEPGEPVEQLTPVLVDDDRPLGRPHQVRAVAVHGAVVREGVEMVRLVEAPELGHIEGRHAVHESTNPRRVATLGHPW